MAKWRMILPVFMISVGSVMGQTMITPAPAPPFTLPDASGTPVSLSSYKGKMVLVQFWASWCVPCRMENRKLAKRYPRFRNLPFEILSISVDTEPQKWRNAILNDKMTWPQLLDHTGAPGCVACRWRAGVLPASFLVDPEGAVIVADAASLLIHDPGGFRALLQKRLAAEQRF